MLITICKHEIKNKNKSLFGLVDTGGSRLAHKKILNYIHERKIHFITTIFNVKIAIKTTINILTDIYVWFIQFSCQII